MSCSACNHNKNDDHQRKGQQKRKQLLKVEYTTCAIRDINLKKNITDANIKPEQDPFVFLKPHIVSTSEISTLIPVEGRSRP